MKNKNLAFLLSIISGIFLILSGTNGVPLLTKISEFVLGYFDIKIIEIIFTLLTAVASFGGVSVIIGGFLIYRKEMGLGRFLIIIGTGAGLISLLLNFLIFMTTEGILVGWFLSFSTLGIIFSVLARRVVKPKTHSLKRKWRKLIN